MRGNVLLDKMELVNPAYVEAADDMPIYKKRSWVKWSAVAACLALIVFAAVMIITQKAPERLAQLPMLTVSQCEEAGLGFEGYRAYDISELVNANPWDEDMQIAELPVYKNPVTYDDQFTAAGTDLNAMRKFLSDIAGRLALNTESLTVTESDGAFEPTSLRIETDDLKIEVDQTMTAVIRFHPAIALPDEYNFTDYASYEEISAVAEYLKEEFSSLIGFENPQVNVCGGDYDSSQRQKYSIEFYNEGNSNVEQIVNYNFNRIVFYCDDDGKLFLVRVYSPNLTQKVADYPVISPAEAMRLLSKGQYITSVPYGFSGTEFVAKAELIYRTGNLEAYFMPYYRFYVEIPELEDDGMKTYGAYYVPAVKEAYITNMPKWDGRFN